VQIRPIKPKLKPPDNERLKVKFDILVLTFGFKFKLRRYNKELCEGKRRGEFVQRQQRQGIIKHARHVFHHVLDRRMMSQMTERD
jgi:hypothetical protein